MNTHGKVWENGQNIWKRIRYSNKIPFCTNMNVLIIYPFYNQRELIHDFASKLAEKGICADVICISHYHYEKFSLIKWPKLFLKAVEFVNSSKWGLGVKLMKYLLDQKFLSKLFPLYDLVDFHAYYTSYNKWLRACLFKKIKFDITPWGSDLMRTNNKTKEKLKYGFDNCYRIKLTENLHDVLVASYGDVYNNKCRIVYFGNSGLDHVDSLNERETNECKKRLYGEIGKKRIVVCGYNSIPSQNHQKIIDALSQLTKDEKDYIHVVFPMTYGTRPGYIDIIKNEMENTGISYTILDHFLDSSEVAVIRKTADIVINVQDTDALSTSLQTHLYCGNVCIFGKWLTYSPYTNNGIYYTQTSMEDIAKHLRDVLHNYSEHQSRCIANHEKIKKIFSWEAAITKQVLAYGE